MDSLKFIGTVKWFGTSSGAKYGFINCEDAVNIKDGVFFHKNNILKPSQDKLDQLIENQIATFNLRKNPKTGKTEAFNILLLEDESDKEFVCKSLLKSFSFKSGNILSEKLLRFVNKEKWNLSEYISEKDLSDFLANKNNSEKFIEITKLFTEFFTKKPSKFNVVINYIVDEILETPLKFVAILNKIASAVEDSEQLSRQLFERLINFIELDKIKLVNHTQASELFKLLIKSNLESYIPICLDKLDFSVLQIFVLSGIKDYFSKSDYDYALALFTKNSQFQNFLTNTSNIRKFFLNLDNNQCNKILDEIDESTKLLLWLDNYISLPDYEKYIDTVYSMPFESQKKFIHKVSNLNSSVNFDQFSTVIQNLANNYISEIKQEPSTLNANIDEFTKDIQFHQDITRQFLEKILNLIDCEEYKFIDYKQLILFFNKLTEHNLESKISICLCKVDFEILQQLVLESDNSHETTRQLALRLFINNPKFKDFLLLGKDTQKFFDSINQFQCNEIIKSIDETTKLVLWINGNIENFNFENYKEVIYLLPAESQKKFVKKVLYLVATGEARITLPQFLSINSNDYSVNVIFEILRKMTGGVGLTNHSLKVDMLKAITKSNLVNHANDILNISGFFNYCTGRVCEFSREVKPEGMNKNDTHSGLNNIPFNISVGEFVGYGKLINNKQFYYVKREIQRVSDINFKPILCDGRLSLKPYTEFPNLSEGQEKFWWCKNQRCFAISRQYNDIEDWENYTLLDFLKIFNIPHNEKNIELLYGTINHVNRFLEHLNCTSCGKLLKPEGRTQYCFYNVSTFSCDNPQCINPDRKVYISHCSNFHCNNTIDSRKSVKCSNSWVICNECFACCDEKRLGDRNKFREINGLSQIHWNPPHRGKEILCPKCAMPLNFQNSEQKQLDYKSRYC